MYFKCWNTFVVKKFMTETRFYMREAQGWELLSPLPLIFLFSNVLEENI